MRKTIFLVIISLILITFLTGCNSAATNSLPAGAIPTVPATDSSEELVANPPTFGPYIGTLPTTPLIVFAGDVPTLATALPPEFSYLAQTVQLLAPAKYEYFDERQSSTALTEMLTAANWAIDPLYRPTRAKNILVVWAGQADLASGAPAEQVYQDLVTYCKARSVVGFKVVVLTLLPDNSTPPNANYEAQRKKLNELIRKNWSRFADALADVGALPALDGSNTAANAKFYQDDGIHLTKAGHALLAETIKNVIRLL